MSILNEIAEHARERVEAAKNRYPLAEIRRDALGMSKGCFEFETALAKPGLSFICECKKASPSKGVIAPDFPYIDIARSYEAAEADCISVLTEPKWFLGKDDYLKEISEAVSIPCLRKDFTVDEYMIYEAKLLGASAVLLICSILSVEQLTEYIGISDELGLSALVETHNESEIHKALSARARIVGVNNRDLRDFTVDISTSLQLRQMVPDDVLFVSESGIASAEDVAGAESAGADAVLVGEVLMRATDRPGRLRELKSLLVKRGDKND